MYIFLCGSGTLTTFRASSLSEVKQKTRSIDTRNMVRGAELWGPGRLIVIVIPVVFLQSWLFEHCMICVALSISVISSNIENEGVSL